MRLTLPLALLVLAGSLASTVQAGSRVDTTAPNIAVTVPVANPCIAGNLVLAGAGTVNAVTLTVKKGSKLVIQADVTDAGGLASIGIDIRQAGGTWFSAGTFGPGDLPWGATMSTTGAPDGNYEIKATAADTSANSSETAAVPFRICNKASGTGAAAAPARPEPSRAGYCLNGRFLDLELGQPDVDPAYKGAVPAIYIDGVGITCDPPIGRRDMGFKVDGTGAHPVPGAPPDLRAIYEHYE